MKTHKRIAAFVLVALLMLTDQASALSVREYKSLTKQQRAESVANAIEKIIADVGKVKPDVAKAIHEYFYEKPADQPAPPGLIAFGGDLLAVEDSADQGKLDLDKVQIEGILLGVIKRDVMPKFRSQEKK
jgi:hypothetical protein